MYRDDNVALENNNFSLKFNWEKIISIKDKKKGNLINLDYNNIPSSPSIYKWIFKDEKEVKKVYIGETLNFRNRIKSYLNPGPTQETNKRINKIILNSKSLSLSKLNIEELKINGKQIIIEGNQDKVLSKKFVRELIENYLIVQHIYVYGRGTELLNEANRKSKIVKKLKSE